jgi:murein DD-endopeptidase MepM/ murein hydrolase activator NlpD
MDLTRRPLAALTFIALLSSTSASQTTGRTITAAQGTVVRWSSPGTERCTMGNRSWPPIGESCYYPIDLEHKPGAIRISRKGSGPAEIAHVTVESHDYGTQEIQLPDIPQAHPSAADLQRNGRERVLLEKVFRGRQGPARFKLPLGPPFRPFTAGKSFGVNRVFDGEPAPQRHTGTDYPAAAGASVLAVADGTVVMAQDLFYPGKAVFIDHGGGLITMYFHLSEIQVKNGQQVKSGGRIGLVGTTGRSTGPHLFFGVRWHGARIDPQLVLDDPAKIPAIGP